MSDIVKVQFVNKKLPSGYGGIPYTYIADIPLKIGDIVYAPTKTGALKAKVISVGVTHDEIGFDIAKLASISKLAEDIMPHIGTEPSYVIPYSGEYGTVEAETRFIIPFSGLDAEATTPEPPTCTDCQELALFRRRYQEFSDIPDQRICELAEFARPWVGRQVFRSLRPQAVIALIAHWIYMGQQAEDYAESGVGAVKSLSGENASESYATPNQVNLNADNAYLKESEYGRAFLSMRQPVIR